MSCEKMGFYLQGQAHSVGLYNQNMTVCTISFIIIINRFYIALLSALEQTHYTRM